MKKMSFLSLLIALLAILICAPLSFIASASELSDNAVIVLSGNIDGEKVSVDAVLMQNTGLSSLTVEISYDTNAMTLVNVERGIALASLDYMTTNVDTEEGYAITPFIINWLGDKVTFENDKTTGRLFTMEFSVKDSISDGKYVITLKTEKDKSATYIIDGEVFSKNVLVSGVQVEIVGDKPQSVEEFVPQNEDKVFLFVSIGVAAVTATALTVLIILKVKGKRSWTKVE